MTTGADCTYSLDGAHHFGERKWGAPGAEGSSLPVAVEPKPPTANDAP